ncbi:PhzF family phenazine biosynthesis protein [Neobacillus niacini]|uniref:PhzF family phenazine biosynthesis protein n=1 Tax=Neobacillus niacini TaxID=86668 RepID=UPI00052F6B80|nr:PhzF family phenazine biosynthesis protein [Neobacillus niacini]KGM45627.1 phenazine biosynthesis protein [Neobacillus niacini]MEC1525514.1 PhzF family phenazine biosynthesis protein [Neobacillus niacini]
MKFFIVDVFAENKYEGNQLAVFIPERKMHTTEMQKIAREMNFSETTFIMSGLQDNGGYDVKIFSPDSELPFAGHPTLGTAYVINYLYDCSEGSEVKLNLPVGQIPVIFEDKYAWMTQNQPEFGANVEIDRISAALQINRDDINTDFPIQVVSTGLPSVIVHLKSLDAVSLCKIGHRAYADLLKDLGDVNLLVFTTETASPENDINVRLFMPIPGYLEDPATGSANGNLAGYLLEHNFFNTNEINYRVEQGAFIGRPSLLKIHANKTDDHYLIQVGGQVIVVSEGKWY